MKVVIASCLLLLVSLGPVVASDGQGTIGKVKLVKEMESYQVQPNCTIKCSMYCDMDGFRVERLVEQNAVDDCDNATASPQTNATTVIYKTCQDAFNRSVTQSGVYTIKPDSLQPFDAYCDMDTDGGGWTVLQRRQDGSGNFYRNWAQYKKGFGDLSGEFWLGNDYIHRLTKAGSSKLRVDLEDFSNVKKFAKYSTFRVGDESSKYLLNINGFSGDATDGLSNSAHNYNHNGRRFSTSDQDNDDSSSNCAQLYKGGWWFGNCHYSHLNGQYVNGGTHRSISTGINWYTWKGHYYSLKFSEMKVRGKA